MIKYLKEYRFYITLFLFLLIPVIALDTATRAPRDYRFTDRAILWVTSPFQTAISWTIDQVMDGYEGYIHLWHTKKINTQLFEENRKLLNQIAGLKEAQNENIRLRSLLDFREKLELETVIARVIARDISTDFRAVRINRGENAGIKKGMAVVTHEGVVGRVLRATANTADVVTILDLLSAVDSMIERSRARGVVEGLTDETCILKFVLRTDDIQIGDQLISSGLGGIFPKGVPVGVISKVTKKEFGITQDVEVRPSVDFTKLEEVMVVTQQKAEVLEKEATLSGTKQSGKSVPPAKKDEKKLEAKKPEVKSTPKPSAKPKPTEKPSAAPSASPVATPEGANP